MRTPCWLQQFHEALVGKDGALGSLQSLVIIIIVAFKVTFTVIVFLENAPQSSLDLKSKSLLSVSNRDARIQGDQGLGGCVPHCVGDWGCFLIDLALILLHTDCRST